MATSTETKIPPTVSSSTVGPLGVAHLPRLWTKLTLGSQGRLADGYDYCGAGFDQMTLDALGLDRQKTIDFVKNTKPTYMQFEKWVVDQNGGTVPKDKIKAHNDAVHGYNHAPELGKEMRSASGITNDSVGDAVTLNTVEDLDAMHAHLHGS